MNWRTFRIGLLLYAAFDLFIGGVCGGFLPLSPLAAAQFTTVSGTVTDPNGLPYSNGTITATLITSASPTFTTGGSPYSPPTQAIGLTGSGSFVMQLADNTALSPAGTKWNFQVCSGLGTTQPASGVGSVCFSLAAPITISGATQSISANLNAVALPLTKSPFPAPGSAGLCWESLGALSGQWGWAACSGATSSNWSAIVPGGGTISAGTYNVGTGSTLTVTGSGVINANQVNGATMPLTATVLGTNGSGQAISQTTTGSGSIALANSPSFVTPNLGIPSALNLLNATGLPLATGVLVGSLLANTQLQGSGATTVNGQSCALGAPCTIPFQTNSVSNTSQAGINLLTSTANAVGLTATPVNSGTNQEKLEITGSYTGNAASASSATGLTFGSTTIGTRTAPPTSGQFVVFDGVGLTGANGTSGLNIVNSDQQCAVPGTYNETCVNNSFTSNASILISPRTYTLANQVLISGVNNMDIQCGKGAVFQAGGGFSAAAHSIWKIQGNSYNIRISCPAVLDGTNVTSDGSFNTSVLDVDIASFAISNIVVTAAHGSCGSTADVGASQVWCVTTTGSMAPHAQTGAYVDIMNAQPEDYNSRADLTNFTTADAMPVVWGPITAADSTHIFFATDEHGNPVPSPALSYFQNGTLNFFPHDIYINGFEVKNGAFDGASMQSLNGTATQALTRNITFDQIWAHGSTNFNMTAQFCKQCSILNYKYSVENGDPSQATASGLHVLRNYGLRMQHVNLVNVPVAQTPSPLKIDYGWGDLLDDCTIQYAGAAVGSGAYAPWVDTGLGASVTNCRVYGGDFGVRSEVSKGTVLQGNHVYGTARVGIQTNYRPGSQNIINSGPTTWGCQTYSGDDVVPPVAVGHFPYLWTYNCDNAGAKQYSTDQPQTGVPAHVTFSQDTTAGHFGNHGGTDPSAGTAVAIDATGVAAGNIIAYWNHGITTGGAARTDVSYTITGCGGAGTHTCLVTLTHNSTAVFQLGNEVTVQGASCPLAIAGVFQVNAINNGTPSISYTADNNPGNTGATGDTNCTITVTSANSQFNSTAQRMYIYTSVGAIAAGSIEFCLNGGENGVQPLQCNMLPGQATGVLSFIELASPWTGVVPAKRSFSLVAVAPIASTTIVLSDISHDIYRNENVKVADNDVLNSGQAAYLVAGGYDDSFLDNSCENPGMGGPFTSNQGTCFLVNSGSGNNVSSSRLTFSGNTCRAYFGPSAGANNACFKAAITGGQTISHLHWLGGSYDPADFNGAANALQISASATNSDAQANFPSRLAVSNIAASAGWGTPVVSAVTGNSQWGQFTITTAASGQSANPTVTITFPDPFPFAPVCTFSAVGGTAVWTTTIPTWKSAATSTTSSGAWVYNGTPASSAVTYIVQYSCDGSHSAT